MAKRRQTASVGLYNELIAQANFAQDPNKIVFVQIGRASCRERV